jgi:hypothetical protein
VHVGVPEVARRPTTNAHDSIAVAVGASEPDPAVARAADLNATPETFGDGRWQARRIGSGLARLARGTDPASVRANWCIWWVGVAVLAGCDSFRPSLALTVRCVPLGFQVGLSGLLADEADSSSIPAGRRIRRIGMAVDACPNAILPASSISRPGRSLNQGERGWS